MGETDPQITHTQKDKRKLQVNLWSKKVMHQSITHGIHNINSHIKNPKNTRKSEYTSYIFIEEKTLTKFSSNKS